MALHAVENVGDAFTVTREFLTPIDLRRWLKLALVAFFIGGGMSLPSAQFNASGSPQQVPAEEIPLSLPAETATVVAAVVAVAVALGILFTVVGAIMEFVFIESLRAGTVSIRRYWSERWRQGLRLFGFRIAIGLPLLVIGLGWMALFFLPLVRGVSDPIAPFGVFFLGLPVLFALGLLYALVSSFTTVFVVPIMIKNDSGVLAGWRPLWASIKAEPKQYLAYAVLGFVLNVAAGLLASVAVGIGALVLLVPLGLLAALVYATLSLSSTVGLVVLAALGLVFVFAMIVFWALLQVPVVAYLRFYALLVLGDIDGSLDLISDRRAALDTSSGAQN
jgi:hypothetical protein